MKSLKFSIPACWPRIMAGQKRQTIRLRFVPDLQVNDPIRLVARLREDKKIYDVDMAIANVADIFPIKLGDIDDELGRMDGFESGADCIAGLVRLNKIKEERVPKTYAFVIRFDIIEKFVQSAAEIATKIQEQKEQKAPLDNRGITVIHEGITRTIVGERFKRLESFDSG